jgi:hypothetical protein
LAEQVIGLEVRLRKRLKHNLSWAFYIGLSWCQRGLGWIRKRLGLGFGLKLRLGRSSRRLF